MSPRYKEEDRQELREQNRKALLEAAAVEFARESYQGANTNRIARSAGFASGTLFNYFPTKRALILALLEETAQAHFDFIASAVRDEDAPERRLEKFFQSGFEFISQNLAPARVMVNTIYGADEDFKSHLYQVYVPMFQLLMSEILSPGIEAGTFRPVEPTTMSNLLMIIYLGTASQVTDDGKFLLGAEQVADFVSHALRR